MIRRVFSYRQDRVLVQVTMEMLFLSGCKKDTQLGQGPPDGPVGFGQDGGWSPILVSAQGMA